MTITAKFAATCAACGKPIAAGDTIHWSRGAKPAHQHCISAAQYAAAVARIPAASRAAAPVTRASYTPPRDRGCLACATSPTGMCAQCRHDEYDM